MNSQFKFIFMHIYNKLSFLTHMTLVPFDKFSFEHINSLRFFGGTISIHSLIYYFNLYNLQCEFLLQFTVR